MFNFDILSLLQTLPAIIIGLTVHEFSHAYMAYRCGDYTARDLGRLSLNPMKHIDPLGFLFIIFAGFGWAKPVAFDAYNLKNKNTDVIKIALAGPASNAILAIIFSGILAIVVGNISQANFDTFSFFIGMLYYAIFINWGLFVFNLIPIPPLDGSHVFLSRYTNHPAYYNIYKYGTVGLFLVLFLQSQFHITILPIGPVITFLSEFSLGIFGA